MLIPVFTTNNDLLDRLGKAIPNYDSTYKLRQVTGDDTITEFIDVIVPPLTILDLGSDVFDVEGILGRIASRRLLQHSAVVLISNTDNRTHAEELSTTYPQIISIIPEAQCESLIGGVYNLFESNPYILCKYELQALYTNQVHDAFTLPSHPVTLPIFALSLSRVMHRFKIISEDQVNVLQLVLSELLMNAVEHGNCGITFQQKKEWLNTHSDTFALIAEKCKDEKIGARKIDLEVTVQKDHIHLELRDQGVGFDWKRFLAEQESTMQPGKHGFGILVASRYTNNLTYNATGNALTFDFPLSPEAIKHRDRRYFSNNKSQVTAKQHEVLIEQHSDTSRLFYKHENIYFIIAGTLSVLRDDVEINRLDARDLFCGEMSFLLHRPRNASVAAHTDVRLAELTRREFSDMLGRFPGLSLLLMRAVAVRLDSLNTDLLDHTFQPSQS